MQINKFSKRLKELRLEANLSQKALGDVLHVGQATVAMWEAGTREPSFDMLIKIANYFGQSVDFLLGIVEF